MKKKEFADFEELTCLSRNIAVLAGSEDGGMNIHAVSIDPTKRERAEAYEKFLKPIKENGRKEDRQALIEHAKSGACSWFALHDFYPYDSPDFAQSPEIIGDAAAIMGPGNYIFDLTGSVPLPHSLSAEKYQQVISFLAQSQGAVFVESLERISKHESDMETTSLASIEK